MKKKVLSALLAATLFVGMAIPAFASFPTSTVAGTDEEITALVFTADSYTVKNGSDLDLSEKVTAFVGKDKLVQDPTLEWSIEDNNVDLAFTLTNAGVATASEDKGTAVVTVTANDGKVKATAKLVAAKADADKKDAVTFKFEKASYTLRTGNYTVTDSVAIVPTSDAYAFTKEQFDALKAAKLTLTDRTGAEVKDVVISFDKLDGNKVIFKVDASAAEADLKSLTFSTGKVMFPIGTSTKEQVKSAKAVTTAAVAATKFGKTGSVTIEVGQTYDLNKKIKFGPSNYNFGDGIDSWAQVYYNDDAEYDDYAVVNEDGVVLGVAVGKNKIAATFGEQTVEITVNVVAKGALAASEAKLAADKAALTVGGTYWLEVKNAPSDVANIKWTVEKNGVATILPESGAAIKIFAKKAGTAKVTATYNGVEIGTCVVTVTAAGTTTPVKPGVENPATGDSLFANLF